VPGGTAVYYSLGVPEGGSWQPTAAMPPPNLTDDYPFGAAASVSLVDTRGLQLYQPMAGPQGCLCPDLGELGQDAGVLHVGWALMAPLPPDVETVSVEVGYGPQVEDVPVGEGALTPEQPTPSTELGEGWPALPDAAAVAAVPDPARYVRALVRNVSDTEQRVTTAERPGRVDESLAADVLFAVDSATLTPAARSTLEALGGRLRERATGPITVTGHTDSSGDPGYNVQLSTARAQAVLDALRPVAGASAQFVAAGKGEQEPVADNATPEGRTLNRRVTVTYSVEGP
jgi:OmpA-OmpF porin, OOP family